MSKEQVGYPTKIAKLAGKDEFLDFTDGINFWLSDNELQTGRVVLRYTAYGSKPSYSCTHYLGVDETLALCDDILGFRFRTNKNEKVRGEFAPVFEHMRGGDGKGYGHPEMTLCSSSFKVSVENSTKYPNDKMIFMEIVQSEGVKQPSGIVSPAQGKEKKIARFSVQLSLLRPKLAMLKAYIEAKMVTSKMMMDIHEADYKRREARQQASGNNYSNKGSAGFTGSDEPDVSTYEEPPVEG